MALEKWLSHMTCEEMEEYLAELVSRLDELDQSDYFGTEGWQSFLMGEH